MSEDFYPGEGWREVPHGEPKSKPNMRVTQPDGSIHWYAREVPSTFTLPTEPYTVIRATWKTDAGPSVLTLTEPEVWKGGGWTYGPAALAADITGFEVLAEPDTVERGIRMEEALRDERRDTAKAVLDRIASEPWAREVDLTKWRSEFGVES